MRRRPRDLLTAAAAFWDARATPLSVLLMSVLLS